MAINAQEILAAKIMGGLLANETIGFQKPAIDLALQADAEAALLIATYTGVGNSDAFADAALEGLRANKFFNDKSGADIVDLAIAIATNVDAKANAEFVEYQAAAIKGTCANAVIDGDPIQASTLIDAIATVMGASIA